MNLSCKHKIAGLLFFLPLIFLLADPIISSEMAEEVVEESVTFPQIFALLVVLFLAQLVVIGSIWLISLAARTAKQKAKLKAGSWQDDLPPKS